MPLLEVRNLHAQYAYAPVLRGVSFSVDAVVRVKIGDGAGLTEMLDAKRTRPMPLHRTKPCERCGMAVEHGYDTAMRWNIGEQTLDMRTRMDEAALARALRRGPARIETIR